MPTKDINLSNKKIKNLTTYYGEKAKGREFGVAGGGNL